MDDPKFLYVSDDPELVRHPPGVLFRAPLPPGGEVARILIDHVNATQDLKAAPPVAGRQIRLLAWLVNLGPKAGTIQLAGTAGTKERNGMDAGHKTGSRFLQMRESGPNAGVQNVPLLKDATEPLLDVLLDPGTSTENGECITGLFDVQGDAIGNTYEVRVIVCDPSEGIDAFRGLADAVDDGKQRRGVFVIDGAAGVTPVPFGCAPFRIGVTTYERAAFDTYNGPAYAGEFGLTKRFSCAIDGGSAGRTAMLSQRAGGGGATATYLIDGSVFESSQFQPSDEYLKVTTLDVPKNTKHAVRLTTMAHINSTLPIDLQIAPNLSEGGSKITKTA